MKNYLVLAATIGLTSTPTYAFLDSLTDKEEQQGLMDMVAKGMSAESTPIADQLTEQLPVSKQQAMTGGSALLSLAQSQLTSGQNKELTSLIPGLAEFNQVSTLASGLQDMPAVKKAFESVGLDPSMISQFTPVILGYLTEQGASSGLLTSLEKLWSE
ncbi:DUF2780 domain-containing protein [Vibrio sp. SCSIO 43135]|uniref:DUF2780 domain-containing protein n=1 Tax=Vibrio sp. SCSIO 43135 TaxID=2819096 RepID=UPI002074EA53|nr:DUF2780 domain-containing protein [Vibrio sp. SCSIO 43135]USD41425.1 DUF2780 domain-containing protein [Vibrio sp. SCSIO 43135]